MPCRMPPQTRGPPESPCGEKGSLSENLLIQCPHPHLNHHSQSQSKSNPTPTQLTTTQFNPAPTQHNQIQLSQPMSNLTPCNPNLTQPLQLLHLKLNQTHTQPHFQPHSTLNYHVLCIPNTIYRLPQLTLTYFPSKIKPNPLPFSTPAHPLSNQPPHRPPQTQPNPPTVANSNRSSIVTAFLLHLQTYP